MMNLDYEPARGKERELKAYREAGTQGHSKGDFSSFSFPESDMVFLAAKFINY